MKGNKNKVDDKKLEQQAKYYDEIDIVKELKKKKLYLIEETERISINVPKNILLSAKKIGNSTGTGYQNTLKTAMAIGLHQLSKQL